jgi:hypothetical protein
MGKTMVTRGLVLAACAALALAGCGPKSAGGGGTAGAEKPGAFGGLFPANAPDYSATYKVGPGGEISMTVYSSGAKTRSETALPSAGGVKMVTLMDRAAKDYVSFAEGPGMPKRANKLSADDIKQFEQNFPRPDGAAAPTKIGADTVAGLSCTIWRIEPGASVAPETAQPLEACVTDDGIMLRVGAPDAPRMIATSVTRGPQDAALFALPAGYEVVDMGDCMGVMRQYGEAMRTGGAKPNQAKVEACQKKMMAGIGAP